MTALSTGPSAPTERVRSALVVAGLLGGAATASGIALTATSGWLIVRASERPVILTLLAAIVAVRTFGIARPLFRYVERLRSHDASLADLAERRTRVYSGLLPLTPARLGRRSRTSVLSGVVDDLTDVVEAQVRVTVPVLASLTAGTLAVVLCTAVVPLVGLLLAGFLVALAGVCWLAWRLESSAQADLLEARAEVAQVCDLVARSASELQAIGAQGSALDWLDSAQTRLADATRRQSRGRALVAALLLAGTSVTAVAAAFVAATSGVSPALAALLVVTPVALGDALAPLADAMRARARADGAAARLGALLDQRPAVTEGPTTRGIPAGPVHLTLTGVTASWTGERTDLAPLDLDLAPGSSLAVVGANGSGKSTLLAVLARHLDPTGGRYAVNGVDVADLPLAAVRGLVALVDDEPAVFAATVRDNLRLARPEASDEAIDDALARAGLGPWLAALPDRLDTPLGTHGRGISGGERARLAVARALLSARPVILLDEPVAHLDHATAVGVLDDLVRGSGGATVVMVSHRPEGLDGFDRILDLGRGR